MTGEAHRPYRKLQMRAVRKITFTETKVHMERLPNTICLSETGLPMKVQGCSVTSSVSSHVAVDVGA